MTDGRKMGRRMIAKCEKGWKESSSAIKWVIRGWISFAKWEENELEDRRELGSFGILLTRPMLQGGLVPKESR